MTIYWERCGVCGRHKPTRRCTLNPELRVCPRCCLACPKREVCPRPAWFPTIQVQARRRVSPSDKERLLEELLSRLG